jgi:hypothetical protein
MLPWSWDKTPAIGLVFVAHVALLAGAAAAQTPSIDDARSDHAKGDYRAALTKLDRIIASSAAGPSSAEKYQLLMLRGECQLQLKDRTGAVATFKSAAKNASDLNQLAEAKANALIIDRSSMGRFTPRSGSSREPVDILPIESRKQAMALLQADLWSQYKSQIDAALKATTLPPIEKVFVPLSDIFFLETAATGQANETGKVMRELGQLTYRMIETDVTRLARRVEQLTLAANSSAGGDWGGVRRGLHSPERDELKAAAPYLAKLRDSVTEYRGIAKRLGGNEQRWDELVLEINDTLAAAEALANDR